MKTGDSNYGKIVRDRDTLNCWCPICDKPLEAPKVYKSSNRQVKLSSEWLFINVEWNIEFCVHPKCKREISEKNIYTILKKLGIPYKDQLLGVAFDSNKK